MDLAHEIQQLAELRARGELSEEEFARAKERLLAYGIGIRPAGIRRQSTSRVFGLPLWSIALGPDPERGESRGHARGIFALGDQATGVFALGGWARGVVAIGGLATGAIALGGCSVGLLLGIGGLAVGSLALGGAAVGGLAVGGFAIGGAAIGGCAIGWYSMGALSIGPHPVGHAVKDPAALDFFEHWFPWLRH